MADTETETKADHGTDLGGLPTLLAAIIVVAVGAAVGTFVPTLSAVIATGVVLGSLSLLDSDSLVVQAIGSCGFGGGLVVAIGSLLVAHPAATVGVLAVFATGTALVVGENRRVLAGRVARDSTAGALGVGIVLTMSILGGLGTTVVVIQHVRSALTQSPFAAFVSLGLLFGLTVVVFDLGRSVLEPWLPDDALASVPSVTDTIDRVIELPTAAQYVIGFGVVALIVTDTSGAFESALLALGPVGTGVETVLQSGILHGLVGLVALSALGIVSGTALAPAGRAWLGSYPLRTLVFSVGGGVVAAGTIIATVTYPASLPIPALGVLIAVVGLFALTSVLVTIGGDIVEISGHSSDSIRRYCLALGGAALFATTAIGAVNGLEALAVFAGVGASILVWDLGENTLTLRRQLGDVDTRESELVHATGSVLVGGLGIAVGVVAMYGIGNVSPPDERWQALAPLALAMIALFVFVLLVGRDGERDEILEWLRLGVHFGKRSMSSPVVFALCCLALISIALIALGFAEIVLFVLVVALPFVLLLVLTSSSGRVYDHR